MTGVVMGKILKTIVSVSKIIFLITVGITVGIVGTAIVKFPFYLLIGIPYDGFNIENPFDDILAVIFACIFTNLFIGKNKSQKE